MTTYPLLTLACTIDSTGITAPSYNDILTSLQASFRAIYGSDVYLDNDSQDGQLLALIASAINDCNQRTIDTFNAFSPLMAQGAHLSSLVKINGIVRHVSSNSSALVTITGVFGTVISNGLVGDNLNLGTQWALPATVTIPASGTIDVTAVCTTPGAVTATANSLTQILNPTRGWQTVNNAADATIGDPVETDAELRIRQSKSTAQPSIGIGVGLLGGIASIAGVGRCKLYENSTDTTDGNGLPPHSISAVVEGGDAQTIASTIALKKGQGVDTYGDVTKIVVDPQGIGQTISFYQLTEVPITVEIHLTELTGWLTTTEDSIAQTVADYLNGLPIGNMVYLSKLWGPAGLNNMGLGDTFDVTAILISRDGNPVSNSDVSIAFNEAAQCDPSTDITFVTTP